MQIPLEDDLLEEEGLGAAVAAVAVTAGSNPDRGGFSSVLRFSSSSSELEPSAVCFLISALISLPGVRREERTCRWGIGGGGSGRRGGGSGG